MIVNDCSHIISDDKTFRIDKEEHEDSKKPNIIIHFNSNRNYREEIIT